MRSNDKCKVGPDNDEGGGTRKEKDMDLPPMPKRPSLVSIDSEDENKMVEVTSLKYFYYTVLISHFTGYSTTALIPRQWKTGLR